MRSGAGKLAAIDDEVFVAQRPFLKPAFENLSSSRRIARLRGQRGSRGVRRHAVMWHCPPGVILRRGLRKPDIPCVARKLSGFQRIYNRIAIADLAAGGIDEIRATLHLIDELFIEKILG